MTTHQKYEVGGGHRWYVACLGLAAVAIWVTVGVLSVAAATTVNLGRATPFAVLAGTTVTNTGPSTVAGSLGVDPGSAVTGFPPGTVSDGTIQAADAVALGAQDDLTTAYGQAAGEGPPTAEGADLGGDTLVPGVYQSSTPDGPLALTGTLTLNGAGVYIFQTGSTLTANTDSTVVLEGGASACDVFWQVGSQATLNGPTFVGTVMANTTIAVGSSVTVDGRLSPNGCGHADRRHDQRVGLFHRRLHHPQHHHPGDRSGRTRGGDSAGHQWAGATWCGCGIGRHPPPTRCGPTSLVAGPWEADPGRSVRQRTDAGSK